MSTVHIRLKDIFDVAVACHVIFYPGDTPFFSGSALALSGPHSILIDADGEGSVTLLPGRYTVRFAKVTGNTDTLIILVPAEEGSYELQDLVCAGDWVLPFRDFLKKSQNLADVADKAAAFGAIKQPASETASGTVELATLAEADAGTDATRAVTPAALAGLARWSSLHPKLKLVNVANTAGRLALTTEELNLGDWVEQTDTHAVYQVLDPTRPALERSYVEVGIRPAPQAALSDGLLAEWLFAPGSELTDSSGNGNTLSINNSGPVFDTVDGRRAAIINVEGDNFQSGVLTLPDTLTMTGWARSAQNSGFPQAATWAGIAFHCFHGNLEMPVILMADGGLTPYTTGNDGEWFFFAARWDGTGWKLTIRDMTVETSDPAPGYDEQWKFPNVIFGRDGFIGALSAFRIWGRVLSDSEMIQVYSFNP